MPQSKAHKTAPNYPLTYIPKTYDANGDPLPVPPGATGVAFEVQLEPSGAGRQDTGLGFDVSTADVEGTVTKTPYATLTLPTGVGAGTTFPLTFRGRPGYLTIGVAPDDQHPKVAKLLGETFRARWQSS